MPVGSLPANKTTTRMLLPLLLMANPGTEPSAAASQHGDPFRQCACHSLPQTDMASRCREKRWAEGRDNWRLLASYPLVCRVESAGRASRPLSREKVHLFTMTTCGLHKNTRVSCHALLQGIFSTQESNPSLLSLLHYRQILYLLSHLGSPCEWLCRPNKLSLE